jgi:hypothetical protein
MRGEEPDPLRECRRVAKSLPGGVATDIEVSPVVHAAPLEIAVVEGEAQWLDEVEFGPGKGAQPPDISSVLGDLRLEKNDLQRLSHAHR